MITLNPINPNNPSDTTAVLPEGRLVGGNPSTQSRSTDYTTKAPLSNDDGTPKMLTSFRFAIPKGVETHWNQTPWGAQIWNEAVSAFPNGEYQMPNFAWKIEDGDSTVPRQSGSKPALDEGFPGHWVLKLNAIPNTKIECYKRTGASFGSPLERIADTDKTTIKTGYYGLVSISVKRNKEGGIPGLYITPLGYCQTREGQVIEGSATVDATSAFGGQVMASAPAAQGYTPPPQQAAYPAPTPVQNTTFMNPPPPPSGAATPPPPPPSSPQERLYNLAGNMYTRAQLLGYNYTDEQINSSIYFCISVIAS